MISMKNKEKMIPILYFIAGICFFISAALGKNYTFLPLGFCFVVLGIVNIKKKPDREKKDENDDQ